MVLTWFVQAMKEALNNQPPFHVFLESFPSFWDGFIRKLLKSRDFAPESIGFVHREVLRQECIGAGIPSGEVCFVGVKPRLHFSEQRKQEKSKTNVVHRSTLGVDGTTHFQEILEVSVGILECLFTEWTHLNHVHQSRLELKTIISLVGVQVQ